MALVDVGGVNLVPGIITRVEAAPGEKTVLLDATDELCGAIIKIPKTGNIIKIGFRTFTVAASDPLKVSLQTVDEDTGRPTGTLIHADAYGVRASIVASTTYWVSLQNPVAVTRGTDVAIVVEIDVYTDAFLRIAAAITNFPAASIRLPYMFQFIGSTWGFQDDTPNFGLEYDDGVIEPIIGVFPAVTSGSTLWNSTSNPDRIGQRFSLPYNCRVSGILLPCDLDGDADIEFYDSDGITIIPDGIVSLDKDIRSGASGGVFLVPLVTPIELTKDTFYRTAIHPTSGTNIRLYYLDVTDDGASKAMNAIDGGVNWHATSCNGVPPSESDWTQELTRRYLMGIIIDQLDDGVAVCDFPELGEVEKGVKFDNDTKTGTRKDAPEEDVKEGEQYGEDGTELTGTYTQNVVGIGTIVGQSTAGIVTGD